MERGGGGTGGRLRAALRDKMDCYSGPDGQSVRIARQGKTCRMDGWIDYDACVEESDAEGETATNGG
jgi:hypothetical protein